MNETAVMPPRRRRRPLVYGTARPPAVHLRDRQNPVALPTYPARGALSAIQREAFMLVEIRDRTTAEVAEALAIEWVTAESTLEQLRRRLLVERIPGRPVTWRRR